MKKEALVKKGKSTGSLWSLVGGVAILLAATLVIAALPDIKRYIKISTM